MARATCRSEESSNKDRYRTLYSVRRQDYLLVRRLNEPLKRRHMVVGNPPSIVYKGILPRVLLTSLIYAKFSESCADPPIYSMATWPVRVCQRCIVADKVVTRNALALLISNLSSAQFEHS
jgi:hypothetical protein